ncbi:MAG: GNAT family N-acetyltransferase, partial [Chloroflexota bacterium]
AVLPAEQGKGIGQKLVHAFLKRASMQGARQVDLTTDLDDNEGTNLFYRQLGFRLERSFTTPEGREMNQYLIDLS